MVLNNEQVAKIKSLNHKQIELDSSFGTSNGWMCEGADDEEIVFFNNDLGLMFYADYYGNIKGNVDFEISDALKEIVKLEGQKCQIAYYGKLDNPYKI